MKKVKRNIIIAAVLLFVCAAVYLNWSYNNSWGAADPAMVKAEDENMASLGTDTDAEPASDYFAQARLTRQTSRDEALGLLQTAASAESGMLPAMARMPAAATRVRRFIRNVLFGYEPPRGGAWRHYARGCRGPSGRLKVC